MNRPSDPDMTRRLIDHARNKLPDLTMRTTFIVGYPGETERAIRAPALTLSESEEFDHVGVFTYSPEPGTVAANLVDHVPSAVAEERRGRIMEAQQRISLRKNQALVGSTLEVLIEGSGEMENEDGSIEPIAVGRARRHAPEVDGLVFVPGSIPVGELIDVTITDAGRMTSGVPAAYGVIVEKGASTKRSARPAESQTAESPGPMAKLTGT